VLVDKQRATRRLGLLFAVVAIALGIGQGVVGNAVAAVAGCAVGCTLAGAVVVKARRSI